MAGSVGGSYTGSAQGGSCVGAPLKDPQVGVTELKMDILRQQKAMDVQATTVGQLLSEVHELRVIVANSQGGFQGGGGIGSSEDDMAWLAKLLAEERQLWQVEFETNRAELEAKLAYVIETTAQIEDKLCRTYDAFDEQVMVIAEQLKVHETALDGVGGRFQDVVRQVEMSIEEQLEVVEANTTQVHQALKEEIDSRFSEMQSIRDLLADQKRDPSQSQTTQMQLEPAPTMIVGGGGIPSTEMEHIIDAINTLRGQLEEEGHFRKLSEESFAATSAEFQANLAELQTSVAIALGQSGEGSASAGAENQVTSDATAARLAQVQTSLEARLAEAISEERSGRQIMSGKFARELEEVKEQLLAVGGSVEKEQVKREVEMSKVLTQLVQIEEDGRTLRGIAENVKGAQHEVVEVSNTFQNQIATLQSEAKEQANLERETREAAISRLATEIFEAQASVRAVADNMQDSVIEANKQLEAQVATLSGRIQQVADRAAEDSSRVEAVSRRGDSIEAVAQLRNELEEEVRERQEAHKTLVSQCQLLQTRLEEKGSNIDSAELATLQEDLRTAKAAVDATTRNIEALQQNASEAAAAQEARFVQVRTELLSEVQGPLREGLEALVSDERTARSAAVEVGAQHAAALADVRTRLEQQENGVEARLQAHLTLVEETLRVSSAEERSAREAATASLRLQLESALEASGQQFQTSLADLEAKLQSRGTSSVESVARAQSELERDLIALETKISHASSEECKAREAADAELMHLVRDLQVDSRGAPDAEQIRAICHEEVATIARRMQEVADRVGEDGIRLDGVLKRSEQVEATVAELTGSWEAKHQTQMQSIMQLRSGLEEQKSITARCQETLLEEKEKDTQTVELTALQQDVQRAKATIDDLSWKLLEVSTSAAKGKDSTEELVEMQAMIEALQTKVLQAEAAQEALLVKARTELLVEVQGPLGERFEAMVRDERSARTAAVEAALQQFKTAHDEEAGERRAALADVNARLEREESGVEERLQSHLTLVEETLRALSTEERCAREATDSALRQQLESALDASSQQVQNCLEDMERRLQGMGGAADVAGMARAQNELERQVNALEGKLVEASSARETSDAQVMSLLRDLQVANQSGPDAEEIRAVFQTEVESLSTRIQRVGDRVSEDAGRLDAVSGLFQRMEAQFDTLSGRIQQVSDRLAQDSSRLDEVSKRSEHTEAKVDQIGASQEVDQIWDEVSKIEARLQESVARERDAREAEQLTRQQFIPVATPEMGEWAGELTRRITEEQAIRRNEIAEVVSQTTAALAEINESFAKHLEAVDAKNNDFQRLKDGLTHERTERLAQLASLRREITRTMEGERQATVSEVTRVTSSLKEELHGQFQSAAHVEDIQRLTEQLQKVRQSSGTEDYSRLLELRESVDESIAAIKVELDDIRVTLAAPTAANDNDGNVMEEIASEFPKDGPARPSRLFDVRLSKLGSLPFSCITTAEDRKPSPELVHVHRGDENFANGMSPAPAASSTSRR